MPAGQSTGTTMSRSGKSGRCENLFVGPSVPEFSGVEGLLFESEFGQELAFGNYTPGRYAWILEGVKPLADPIPAKGALSLWEWKDTRNG